MNIRAFKNNLFIATPAKLNLFLEILKRRNDGFHELETVMTKFSIFDYLYFSSSRPDQSDPFQLEVRVSRTIPGDIIPLDENNLVIKSLRLMRDLAGNSFGMRVTLFKNIPIQAGLGGASGNAAATIIAANRMWNLRWSYERLLDVAAQIGSDVAFFLGDSLARCTGKGEKVQNLKSRCRLNIVVAKPQAGLSTAVVYSQCDVPDQPKNSQSVLSALVSGQISMIGKELFNRLQPAAALGNDDMATIQGEFNKTNCAGHQLTGSGSCYFGIYRNRKATMTAAKILANRLPDTQVFTGQTLSSRNHCLRT